VILAETLAEGDLLRNDLDRVTPHLSRRDPSPETRGLLHPACKPHPGLVELRKPAASPRRNHVSDQSLRLVSWWTFPLRELSRAWSSTRRRRPSKWTSTRMSNSFRNSWKVHHPEKFKKGTFRSLSRTACCRSLLAPRGSPNLQGRPHHRRPLTALRAPTTVNVVVDADPGGSDVRRRSGSRKRCALRRSPSSPTSPGSPSDPRDPSVPNHPIVTNLFMGVPIGALLNFTDYDPRVRIYTVAHYRL